MESSLSHAQLLIYGTHWLFNVQHCRVVLTQPTFSGCGCPDVFGWNDTHSFFIEAKVSRADFYQDRVKYRGLMSSDPLLGSFRFYLMPSHLVQIETVSSEYGLLWLCDQQVTVIRDAPLRTNQQRDFFTENRMLVGTLRQEAERQTKEKTCFQKLERRSPLLWTRDSGNQVYRQTHDGMVKSYLHRDLDDQIFYGSGSKPCKQPA